MSKLKAAWIGYLKDETTMWDDVETLAKLGYSGCEGGAFLLKGDVKENLRRFHDLGLTVITVGADIKDIRNKEYGGIIERAALLGAKRITTWSCSVNSSFSGKEPCYDDVMRDFEAMEAAAQRLEQEGLAFCYHNHYQEFTQCFKGLTCMDLLLSSTEKIQIELDVGWVTNALWNPVDVINRIAPRLSIIHVKDYINGKKRESEPGYEPVFTALGVGELNLMPVLCAADKNGMEWAVMEQDTMHHLSPVESLICSYYCLKETGYVL